MSWWFIYWITRLDEINSILGIFLVLSTVFTVIWFFLRVMPEVFRHGEDHETERKENNGYTVNLLTFPCLDSNHRSILPALNVEA